MASPRRLRCLSSLARRFLSRHRSAVARTAPTPSTIRDGHSWTSPQASPPHPRRPSAEFGPARDHAQGSRQRTGVLRRDRFRGGFVFPPAGRDGVERSPAFPDLPELDAGCPGPVGRLSRMRANRQEGATGPTRAQAHEGASNDYCCKSLSRKHLRLEPKGLEPSTSWLQTRRSPN